MAPDHEPSQVVTDADVLMNLLASECLEEILATLRVTLIVPPTVSNETIYLEGVEQGSGRVPIDLSPLEAAGLISVPRLEPEELDLVVELATTVDDGEAEVIALAVARQLTMATDDRKARRVAEGRSVSLVSTPELLERWHNASGVPSARVGKALRSIERRSRYRPAAIHPLHDWWTRLAQANAEGEYS